MNILQFMQSPELCGDAFTGSSWDAWRAILAAACKIKMSRKHAALFDQLSGGRNLPVSRVNELWVIAGRRSAKTRIAGLICVYLATVDALLNGAAKRLAAGERGVVALIAVDKAQAKVAFGYISGLIAASPALSAMVTRNDSFSIDLDNRISIEIHANSFRSIRGRTLIAILFDELAFFRSDESANPDVELYRAALPGLATTGGMVIGIGSPYSKRGLLYAKYKKHFGRNDLNLVVQGATADFNPTLNKNIIAKALEEDPAGAKSEWLGLFRDDLEQFVSHEVVEQCTRQEPLELPCDGRFKYFAFIDPSGGAQDSMTLAIAHIEKKIAVIDLLREWKPPFNPDHVVAQIADVMKSYRTTSAKSDKYAGVWVVESFSKHNIRVEQSAEPKSDLYHNLLPLLNSGRCELPPIVKLHTQLTSLERKVSRAGKDSIDHPPGGHDDLANVAAGAATNIITNQSPPLKDWI
jgi:hypothetical protein